MSVRAALISFHSINATTELSSFRILHFLVSHSVLCLFTPLLVGDYNILYSFTSEIYCMCGTQWRSYYSIILCSQKEYCQNFIYCQNHGSKADQSNPLQSARVCNEHTTNNVRQMWSKDSGHSSRRQYILYRIEYTQIPIVCIWLLLINEKLGEYTHNDDVMIESDSSSFFLSFIHINHFLIVQL